MLCTLIGAIFLSINIQVGLNMHLYEDIGDASRPFEGRHLVFIVVWVQLSFTIQQQHQDIKNILLSHR